MIRTATVLLIAVLGMTVSPVQAGVQGAYKPGYKPRFEPKPSAHVTYRPQGERPRPPATYRPTFQSAPKRPTFSAPPSPPKKS